MIRLRAPAKLNLYLRVLGRRPDGYHDLETLFERVDLADELVFEPAATLQLTCDDASLSCGEDNLILKAARLLQQEIGARPHTNRAHTQDQASIGVGARIHLTKRIPIAAGLGGGSSDAAATLLGLNELWGLRYGAEQLRSLAATLGSDVPFFLSPTPFAIGRGRGEQCEPIQHALHLFQVLVSPRERLSTKEIYDALDQTRNQEGDFNLTASTPSISMVVHALRNGSLGELAKGLWNDLEPEAIRRCPPISFIQSHLRSSGCLGTRLSGSGSSVFGLCRDAAHAHGVAAALRKCAAPTWRIEIIQTDSPSLVGSPSTR